MSQFNFEHLQKFCAAHNSTKKKTQRDCKQHRPCEYECLAKQRSEIYIGIFMRYNVSTLLSKRCIASGMAQAKNFIKTKIN